MQNKKTETSLTEYIVIRDDIQEEDVLALANGRIAAIVVKNFYDTSISEMSMEHIKKNMHYYLTPPIGRFGMSFYETKGEQGIMDDYYQRAIGSIQEIRQIFSPYLSPVDLLRLRLQEKWKAGADIGNIDGRKMFVGVCRILEPNVDILAHQDNLSKDAPDSVNAKLILAQLAANVYLDMPKNGGELELWDRVYDDESYNQMIEDGSYGIDRSRLPPPSYIIKPESGDLIIFNAGRLHGVKSGIDHSRISISCFIGYYGENKPLTYWS